MAALALLLLGIFLFGGWEESRAQVRSIGSVPSLQPLTCSTSGPTHGPAIGFLGDSISHNKEGGVSPGEVAAAILHARAVICAVPGSATADWLGTPRFHQAVAAFHAARVRLVSIMLGDNDSRYDHQVPVATYRTRLQAIVVALRDEGFRVVLQTPPAASNPLFDATLLAQYRGVLGGAALRLPTLDGVHPDAAGVRLLGTQWAARLR